MLRRGFFKVLSALPFVSLPKPEEEKPPEPVKRYELFIGLDPDIVKDTPSGTAPSDGRFKMVEGLKT